MKKASILFVANSFGNDACAYLADIARDRGIELTIGCLYIGGCDVDTHIKCIKENLPRYDYHIYEPKVGYWKTIPNHTSIDAIKERKWDYVSLQQASHFSGKPERYESIPELIALIKGLVISPVKFLWHMTWAYASYSEHGSFPDYNRDSEYMYQCIKRCVEDKILTNPDFFKVIPNGDIIHEVKKVAPADWVQQPDGFHLADAGRYVAAVGVLRTLFEFDVKAVGYVPYYLWDDLKNKSLEAASRAFEK